MPKANYLAKGSFTANQLADTSLFHKRLVHLGFEEPMVNFIYHTSMPKGHPDFMNKSVAQKTFMPEIKYLTAITRAQNAQTLILTHLWHGQEIDQYAEDYKKRTPAEKKGTRSRIAPEVKAKQLAEKQLKAEFRENNKIKNKRGKLPKEFKKEYDEYLKQNLEELSQKILE